MIHTSKAFRQDKLKNRNKSFQEQLEISIANENEGCRSAAILFRFANQGNRSARPGIEIALEQKLRDSGLIDVTHVLKCFAMLLFRDHTQLSKSERILSKTFVCEY